MPQLDFITYRSQVTQVLVVFGGLYRAVTGYVMPLLVRLGVVRGLRMTKLEKEIKESEKGFAREGRYVEGRDIIRDD